MRASGAKVQERTMDDAEYAQRLRDKLLEEAQEVVSAAALEASDPDRSKSLRGELADVLEAMIAITERNNIAFADVQKEAHDKRQVKGGFSRRIYSESVELSVENPLATYYLEHPDRYPQII